MDASDHDSSRDRLLSVRGRKAALHRRRQADAAATAGVHRVTSRRMVDGLVRKAHEVRVDAEIKAALFGAEVDEQRPVKPSTGEAYLFAGLASVLPGLLVLMISGGAWDWFACSTLGSLVILLLAVFTTSRVADQAAAGVPVPRRARQLLPTGSLALAAAALCAYRAVRQGLDPQWAAVILVLVGTVLVAAAASLTRALHVHAQVASQEARTRREHAKAKALADVTKRQQGEFLNGTGQALVSSGDTVSVALIEFAGQVPVPSPGHGDEAGPAHDPKERS